MIRRVTQVGLFASVLVWAVAAFGAPVGSVTATQTMHMAGMASDCCPHAGGDHDTDRPCHRSMTGAWAKLVGGPACQSICAAAAMPDLPTLVPTPPGLQPGVPPPRVFYDVEPTPARARGMAIVCDGQPPTAPVYLLSGRIRR